MSEKIDTILARQAPPTDIVAVTKHDATADPNGPFRGLVFKTVGDIKLTTADGNDRTIPSGVLAPGVLHLIGFTRVWSTGTTAVDIWGVP